MKMNLLIRMASLTLVFLLPLDTFVLPTPWLNNSIKLIALLASVIIGLLFFYRRREIRFTRLHESGFIHLLLFTTYVFWNELLFFSSPDHDTYLIIRNLLLAIVIFLAFALSSRFIKKQLFLSAFKAVAFFCLFIALANIFFHSQLVALGSNFYFPGNLKQYLDYEYHRGRIYSQTSIPIIASIFINFFLSQPSYGSFLLAATTTALVVLWNYRIYFLACFLSAIVFILASRKSFQARRSSFINLAILFAMIIFFISVSGSPLLTRFTLSDKYDREAIISRLHYFEEALSIAYDSLIFGVGSGRYHLYAKPIILEPSVTEIDQGKTRGMVLKADPHNTFFKIFAETGIIGLFLFTLLAIQIIRYDLAAKGNNRPTMKTALRFASWVFLFAILMDTYTETEWFFFWGLRGIIVSLKDYG